MFRPPLRKAISMVILAAFIITSVQNPAYSQVAADTMPTMSAPGVMVHLSPEFTPAYLKGIVIHPDNALKFDFIIYKGDKELTESQKKEEYTRLTKYFLASLAIPDDDQWVNLSPYEKDRIIKDNFGKTEMGRDLLAQDYMLKQITASLIYPEDNLGKKFWDKVYSEAQKQFGTAEIPVNTFNKVWILPDDALIYEKGNTAYVIKNHLKVMLEEDYLALRKHSGIQSVPKDGETHTVASRIVREIVLPELEREVNEGKNFAALRQVYSGMLLATWYKRAIKESLLSKVYANKGKVKGVDQDPKTNEEIYQQYLKAYKKGVFNFIKEDVNKYTNETVPRKYFSGGVVGSYKKAAEELGHETLVRATTISSDNNAALISGLESEKYDYAQVAAKESLEVTADLAMFSGVKKFVGKMLGNGNPEQAVIPVGGNGSLNGTPIQARRVDNTKQLAIYGNTSSDDWKQAIVQDKRWHEGVDFSHLLGSDRVLVLGDTNHDLLGIQRALVEHLMELKKAGVTHLGLEIGSDLSVSDVEKIAQGVWIPHRFKQLVEKAEALGMKVVFIDMPESQQREFTNENKVSFERGVYMGNFVSKFLQDNPTAVMTVVTGYAHIRDYNQIPAQLDKNGFSASLVPLVSEGQQDLNPLGLQVNLYMVPVVQAIREKEFPDWQKRIFKAVISFADNQSMWEEWNEILYYRKHHNEDNGLAGAESFFNDNKAVMLKGAQTLWPEVEDYYALMKVKFIEGTRSFSSEKQNDPVNEEDCRFDPEKFQYWDKDHADAKELLESFKNDFVLIGACDPSVGMSKKKADFSAIIILAVHQDKLYVVDADISRRPQEELADKIIDYCKLRKPLKFVVEENLFRGLLVKFIRDRADDQRVMVPLAEAYNTRNKELRIIGLETYATSGIIVFSKKHHELLEQLKYFPRGDFDDGPDALAMAVSTVELTKEIGFVDLTGSGKYDSKSIKRKPKEITDKWGRTEDHIDFGRPPIEYDEDDDDEGSSSGGIGIVSLT